ncbi:DUF1758 domain-containing protein [Trichonephila clavipes]|nr:DUF1758 domain-containing protein [Trichonephila clavipes]
MLTSGRKVLSSGLVAVETYLGWTLMVKVPQEEPSEENLAMEVLSLFVKEAEISNLWKLDLIGINDPVEKKSNWLAEGIIEEVPKNEVSCYVNCLPHRAVILLSSSPTPIRPVFDVLARLANYPYLNQCLACGPNLIELIPDILRFREREFGTIADIRKAFMQINIRKEDRVFLQFLWWEKMDGKKLRLERERERERECVCQL